MHVRPSGVRSGRGTQRDPRPLSIRPRHQYQRLAVMRESLGMPSFPSARRRVSALAASARPASCGVDPSAVKESLTVARSGLAKRFAVADVRISEGGRWSACASALRANAHTASTASAEAHASRCSVVARAVVREPWEYVMPERRHTPARGHRRLRSGRHRRASGDPNQSHPRDSGEPPYRHPRESGEPPYRHPRESGEPPYRHPRESGEPFLAE